MTMDCRGVASGRCVTVAVIYSSAVSRIQAFWVMKLFRFTDFCVMPDRTAARHLASSIAVCLRRGLRQDGMLIDLRWLPRISRALAFPANQPDGRKLVSRNGASVGFYSGVLAVNLDSWRRGLALESLSSRRIGIMLWSWSGKDL